MAVIPQFADARSLFALRALRMVYRDVPVGQPLLLAAKGRFVMGVDRRDGAVAWKVKLASAHDTELHLVGDVVIVINYGQVLFLDYQSGETRARAALPAISTRPTAIVDEGVLYVASGGVLAAFSLAGELLWAQGFDGGASNLAIALPGHARQREPR